MPKPETKSNAKQSNNKQSNTKATKIDAQATLRKLQAKDPGLKRLLEKAYAYAVFPAVGKANLVIGGALGRGEVFEKGKKVGYATITQLTIGVQIGGDTFDEVVVFESRESFERFKRGKTAFAANASAVLVKAGAASAKDFEKGAAVYVYPHGGMMLELAIGGQRFKFKPADEEQDGGKQKGGQQAGKSSGKSSGKGKGAQGRGQEDEGEEEGQDEGEEAGEGEEGDEEASSSGGGNRALELAGRAVGGVRSAAAKATEMVKRHPVAATVAGVSVVAGLGLMIARAMSGSGAEEGEEDQDSGGEEEEQDEGAQDSAEDSDENQSDEDEDQDRDEEDEDTDARAEDEGEEEDEGDDDGSEEDESENRGVLSRLLSRGKSRA